ncbi:MAG: fumarylacetoacetate hydrolase family protein [Planctomycetota bacterium]|jgi:2-keto-4-pentenoate hydratase/2-oxohepta-3-ene-1,7-dioic acid hydratase in catechol pathway|nr:fumarylacetoacetate hydrolase family protein [Planctomycetota bacterium]
MKALKRVLHPDGHPAWLWGEDNEWQDWTAAGVRDGLSELASLFLDSEMRAGIQKNAPLANSELMAAPVLQPGRPGKALCLGKNFAAHAREFGFEPPSELIWFAKLPDVLCGPGEPIQIPSWLESRVDYEAELVALVGAPLHNASPDACREGIAAYTLGNDFTARNLQGKDRKQSWPWLRCKNLHTFGPIGPVWLPADGLPNWDELTLRCEVNGKIQQESSLDDFLWKPEDALSEISRWCPLLPGDIVFLGTPEGVGPVADGDQVKVSLNDFIELNNPIVLLESVS